MSQASKRFRRFMTAEEFVRAWQGAKDFESFFALYRGKSRSAARARASQLRARGIALRVFAPSSRTPGQRTRHLIHLAKSLRGGK